MTSHEQPIEITLAQPPDCGRCGGPSLLSARYPHTWQTSGGETIAGTREVALCPACDRRVPAADELRALFNSSDRMGQENTAAAGALIGEWLDEVQGASPDPEQLDLEHALWRSGDL